MIRRGLVPCGLWLLVWLWDGAVATAGGVVVYGNLEGWSKAVDAHTGQELWKFKTGSGSSARPRPFGGPMAASTSRSCPALAAGWARS